MAAQQVKAYQCDILNVTNFELNSSDSTSMINLYNGFVYGLY